MSILVVVAHPDDEVLGCGATAARLATLGYDVRACILAAGAEARRHRPKDESLVAHACSASAVLGMKEPIFGGFPNISMNTVSHLEVVQFIEAAIAETGARTILTHHPGDLNNDHFEVSRACQAASRLWQRRSGVQSLRALLFMEVLSSTDWTFPGNGRDFRADAFMEVEDIDIDRKITAMEEYIGVLRPTPHSRSIEAIRALAVLRGAQAHVRHAEAFQVVFQMLREPMFA